MKSKEEYEASIYKKRDAFIVKRKKNIRITTSALSVMICLGAAAVAIPALSEKPDETQALPITNAAGGMTENKIAAEGYGEIATYPVNYDTGIAFTNRNNSEYYNDVCIEAEERKEITNASVTEIYQIPDDEVAVEQGSSEETEATINQQFSNSEDFIAPDSFEGGFNAQGVKPSTKTYKTEEIVAEAKKHVNNADKIIDSQTNVTVSRNAKGTTTYTAYFYTEDKRITVELDSDLKLIELKEKDNSGNAVQVSPGYNPDEE